VIRDRAPIAWAVRAQVSRDETVILEDRDGYVRGAYPQDLTDQRERSRILHVVELHMTVPVQAQAVPGTQIRCDIRQAAHQRLLDPEALQGLLASRAVDTYAGFLQHPAAGLLVQIRRIPEGARRQEVTLEVFDSRLFDTQTPTV
jgi:hypothetical protein